MFISNPPLNNLVLPRPRDCGQEKYHTWSALADLSYRSSLHLIHLQLFFNICCCKIEVNLYVIYWVCKKTFLFLNHLPSKLHKKLTVIVNDHRFSMLLIHVFNTVNLKKKFLSYKILVIFT